MNLYYVSGVVMTPHPQDCDCLSCLLEIDDSPPSNEAAYWCVIEGADETAAADAALTRAGGTGWLDGDPHIEQFGPDAQMRRLPAAVAPVLPGFESIRRDIG